MKKVCIVLVIMVLGTQFLWAATVSLKGTVKNSAGSGIAGVVVALTTMKGISATTDAQGTFTISGTAVSRSILLEQQKFSFSLAGNNLIIGPVFESSNGRIDIFTGNGRRTATLPFRGSGSGKQRVVLPEFTTGLNIIRITIGNEVVTQSLLCLGTSNRYLKNGILNAPTAGTFTLGKQAAAAAAVDTLTASKSGFTDAKVPIDSYEKTDIAIVMQEPVMGEMPLVYDKEFTGVDCPKPTLVADPTTLPPITFLPDPFLMADGKTRMTTREQWRCRRAEIKAILEKYDDGEKPGKPEKFEASLSGNTITMKCGVGSNNITLTATISRPSGAPNTPIPAIIGINGATGSLPANLFSSRGIATITFSTDQIMANGFSSTPRSQGNFYKLYPQTTAGSMIRWAWGVSRVIDALEVLPEAKIDLSRIAVSGCSYQGKIALYAGAYDERIALTLPQESGGGGTISWRYADKLDGPGDKEVEGLHHAQGAPWYAEVLYKYQPENVSPNTLPYDHHELIAMIAPRAVLCIESSKIYRMGAEAARVDALAARRVWKALGVPDRMGATEENTDHCVWANGFTADIEAYLDKFLLGKKDGKSTDILRSKFTSIDTATWIPWETPELK
jgi:hypothetical protein